MAVSQIEEKILGRLAEHTASTNALLSASLYQVLGLSILLSKKLYKARKLRKLDNTRDTKSLQLYHHIIWLAREGLSITEVYILPYCQDGEQGPECRVMAAKLRASLYHVFCLYHNHPPIRDLNGRSPGSSPSSAQTATRVDGSGSPSKQSAPRTGSDGRKRAGKAPLRDPIPSITSEASYVTNPYSTQTPPPTNFATVGGPSDARRTPTRPPGLVPIKISPTQAAASFLLPPLNFVPMAKEHFEMAQHLATSLLAPTHALRLSVAFEHTAFLWDCAKEHDRARKLARRTIKDVYSSADGLDDEEFADASTLVSSLGAIVRRRSNDSTPRSTTGSTQPISPNQRTPRVAPQPTVDRTIAVSPPDRRQKPASPSSYSHIPRAMLRTPERLSTVPEASESIEETPTTRAPSRSPPGSASRNATLSPPVSRLSSRSNAQRRPSSATSAASDKATKRRIVEQAEEQARSRQNSAASRNGTAATAGSASGGGGNGEAHSRQTTPTEGLPTSHDPIMPRQTRGNKRQSIPVSVPPNPASRAAATLSPPPSKAQPAENSQQKMSIPQRPLPPTPTRDAAATLQPPPSHIYATQGPDRRRGEQTPSIPDDRRQAIIRTLKHLSCIKRSAHTTSEAHKSEYTDEVGMSNDSLITAAGCRCRVYISLEKGT